MIVFLMYSYVMLELTQSSMFTLCGRRFCRVFGVKMIDQGFIFSTALAVGCGVGIGWIVRGIFRSRTETTGLASEVSRHVSDNIGFSVIITKNTNASADIFFVTGL